MTRRSRQLPRIAALAWLALAAPAPAEEPDLAALARQAGRECQAGDLDAAAATLGALHARLEARHGGGHDVTRLVAAKLALVERSRGRADEAARIEAAGGEKRGEPDESLVRSLKKLRACSTALVATPQPETRAPSVRERINLANRQYNEGRYEEALQNANDALASLDAATPAGDRTALFETLALASDQLGRVDEARRHALSAEQSARQSGDVALRIKMAILLARLGDLDSALQVLTAVEGAANRGALRAELAEARGDVALRLGSPREAAEQLEAALRGHRSSFGADDPSTAAVLHRLGDARRLSGDFPAALAAYREALRIRRAKLGAAHSETATTLNALGVLYASLGDWQQADASFADAMTVLEAALGAQHPETLTLRSNRALARWGVRQDAAAAADYAAAVAALEKVRGADDPGVAAATRNLADMELELGRARRAEQLVDRALAAQTRSLGAAHPDLAPTRLQRAELLARRGALAPAASEVDLALEALLARRGAEHPTSVHARTLRARIALAQADEPTARRAALGASGALARYTRHTFGAISERQRGLLAENAQEVVGALLSLETAPPREVFVALLPHRDSVLRSVAAAGARAGGELAELRRRYAAALLGRGDDASARSRELAGRIDALEARAAAGARTPERDPEEVLTQACRRLPADAVLVKYAAFEATRAGGALATTSAHAALVVRGGDCSVRRVRLADGDAIERAAEQFAAAMRGERADHAEARAALSELLVAPIGDAVAGARRWLVIPDGALWGVPLGVLPDPEDSSRYLMERVTIGYLTSTFELAEAEPGAPVDAAELHSLLVGAPDFGGGGDGGPVVLTDSGPCRLEPFAPLPGTAREIEEVGALVGPARTLSGAGASKSALASALAAAPRLLHFATHAYFAGSGGCPSGAGARPAGRPREDAPVTPNPLLLSGIVLAGANEPGRVGSAGQRGILTAYEVSGLDLRQARLVVLSACDTGTGLQRRGQEVQGLRWGFRAAGARALVTSLWLSNDVATRRLMRGFYQALLSGQVAADPFRGAEALRSAQLEQVRGERRLGLRRPLTWANFVFSGVL